MRQIGAQLQRLTPRRIAKHIRWQGAQWRQFWWRNRQLVRVPAAQRVPVYFPYFRRQIHNVWATYYTHPLPYSPYAEAKLMHWINWTPPDDRNYIVLSPPESAHIRYIRMPGPARPYVTEVEHALALSGNISDWPHCLASIDYINNILSRDICRIAFTITGGLMEHSKRYVRPELWHKLDYLYPAYPAQPEVERSSGPFTILVIASRFYDKGVPEALNAFRVLRTRHGAAVRMNLVSQDVPAGYELPVGVTLHNVPRMSPEFKSEMYRTADVLFLPVYSDTGACFPEAYAFGVPVVSTRIHNGDEFVQQGETGFLIDPPFFSYSEGYGTRWRTWHDFQEFCEQQSHSGALQMVIEQSVEYLEKMISGQVDMQAMRQAARRLHRERFSPEARNAKLRQIYNRALGGGP